MPKKQSKKRKHTERRKLRKVTSAISNVPTVNKENLTTQNPRELKNWKEFSDFFEEMLNKAEADIERANKLKTENSTEPKIFKTEK